MISCREIYAKTLAKGIAMTAPLLPIRNQALALSQDRYQAQARAQARAQAIRGDGPRSTAVRTAIFENLRAWEASGDASREAAWRAFYALDRANYAQLRKLLVAAHKEVLSAIHQGRLKADPAYRWILDPVDKSSTDILDQDVWEAVYHGA